MRVVVCVFVYFLCVFVFFLVCVFLCSRVVSLWSCLGVCGVVCLHVSGFMCSCVCMSVDLRVCGLVVLFVFI